MKIIFATNNKIGSVLIRLTTHCEWSHCACCFGDVAIEARFGGVAKTTPDEVKSRGRYSEIEVKLKDEKATYEFALNQVGKKYDYRGLAAFWFNRNLEGPENGIALS